MNIGTLTATLGVDSSGLNKSAADFQKFQQQANLSLNSIAQTLDKTGRNIYYFGTAASRFLTLPLALAGATVTKTAKDFEYSMQKIVGLVGVSQKQVNDWSKDILKLGPELGKGPKELADALYFVTSSGFKGAEALDIVTQSAKAAASGLGDTKQVADLVTSAMSAYSSSGLTASKTLDILTAAVREGKGEAADFAGHLGDIIPIASQMGVSFDQVAAAVASVTLTGQSVSKAVTGVRQALFEIAKPSVEAIAAAKGMGVSFGQLRESLANKGLLPTLSMMNELTKKHGENLSKVFPNIRAYAAILSLLGDRYEANVELQKSVTNSTGSNQKAFEAIANTIEHKYNQAVALVQASLIQLGLALKDSIIPIMMGFAKALSNIVQWYTNLSKGQQQFILKLAIFLAALGPVAVAVGLLSRSLAGMIVVIQTVTKAAVAMTTAMMANPYIALTAVIIALGVAFYTLTRNTNTATKELAAYHDEIERGKQLSASQKSIDEQMNVIENLNKTQIAALKERISEELRLEEEFSASLLGKLGTSNFKVIAYKKGSAAEQYSIEYKNAQDRLKILTDYLQQVEAKLKKSKVKKGSEFDPDETERVHKFILNQLEVQIETLKKVGEDYNTELFKIYSGGKTASSLTIKAPKIEFDTRPMENYRKHFMLTADAGDALQKKLADIALQNSIFGQGMSDSEIKAKTLADQIQYVTENIKTMVDQGIRPGNTEAHKFGLTLDQWISQLKDLKNASKSTLSALADEIGKVGSAASSAIGEYISLLNVRKQNELNALQEVEDSKKQSREIADARLRAEDDMANAKNAKERNDIQKNLTQKIASINAAYSAEKELNGKIQAINDAYNAKIKKWAIAQAIINGAIAVTKALAQGGLAALIQVPLITAATTLQIKTIQETQMAEGGVVPAGYPNDTYPAKLTSGEMVVPPGKLPNLQGKGNVEVTVVMDSVIKGTDINFIVKEVQRKYKNSMV